MFAADAGAIVHRSTLFTALLVVLLVAMWATVSALAPYAAEIYPTAIRGVGSGVVAGATKLGGVIALGSRSASWAPPGVAGAALLAAVPAGLAALLLVFVGSRRAGKRLEEISETEQLAVAADSVPARSRASARCGSAASSIRSSSRRGRTRGCTFRRRSCCCTSSARRSSTSGVSFPQIATAMLTCALIEVIVTF